MNANDPAMTVDKEQDAESLKIKRVGSEDVDLSTSIESTRPWSTTSYKRRHTHDFNKRRCTQPQRSSKREVSPRLLVEDLPKISSSHPIEGECVGQGEESTGEAKVVVEQEVICRLTFSGGPQNKKVLTTYTEHVAHSIWNGNDRPLLRCQQHACKLESWDIKKESSRFRDRVAQSGLLPLVETSYKTLNRTLICGMVERWYPDTNTFHLPFGEMTITLDDVNNILGIPIEGKVVCGASLNQNETFDLLVNELGIPREVVIAEFKGQTNMSVRMEFLRDKLNESTDQMTNSDIDRRVKGYLLFLLGCTLFSDKTGTKVSVMYLYLLKNLDEVHQYAWGAAGLAFLYRHLGSASKINAKQIAGYLTLLQAWIYEHILVGRPGIDQAYVEGQPRALRWKQARTQTSMQNSMTIDFFRHMLDNISTNGVAFDPYTDLRPYRPLHPITYYSGCLLCFDIIEPYNPDRVLRQFGFIQTIPLDPLRVTGRTKRGYSVKEYRVVHELHMQNWQRWRNHLLSTESRGSPVVNQEDCEVGYMKWFKEVSHIRVVNPENNVLYSSMKDMTNIGEKEQPDDPIFIMVNRALHFGEREKYADMMDTMRVLRERLCSEWRNKRKIDKASSTKQGGEKGKDGEEGREEGKDGEEGGEEEEDGGEEEDEAN